MKFTNYMTASAYKGYIIRYPWGRVAGVPLIGHSPLFEGIDRGVHCLAGQNKIHVSVLDGNGGEIPCTGCFGPGDIKPPF